jgi:hypothetical protein
VVKRIICLYTFTSEADKERKTSYLAK